MGTSQGTMNDVVDMIKDIVRNKKTGTIYIVSKKRHAAFISFESGNLVAARHRFASGLDALKTIKMIDVATFSFTVKTLVKAHAVEVGNEALLQVFGRSKSTNPRSAIPAPTQLNTEQATLILVKHLGPVGEMLVEDIVSQSSLGDIEQFLLKSVGKMELVKLIVSDLKKINSNHE